MLTTNKPYLCDQVNEGGEGATDTAETAQPAETIDAATVERLRQENEAIQAKNQELILKMQKVSEARRQAEEQARIEAEEKARKAGDYEQLHKSSEQERERLRKQLEEMQNNIAREKEQTTAYQLASDLAEGPNIELLSDFISRRVKHTDEGMRVKDANGNLTVASLEDLKNEFRTNPKFASLLKGPKASGGAALGGASSSPADKVISRADFDKMAPMKKMEFLKSGGRAVD